MKNIYLCLVVALLQFSLLEAGNFADNRGNRNHGSGGGNNNDKGSWGVSVNKDKGRGPQVSAGGRGQVWGSKDGNWAAHVSGQHDMGRGRKPDTSIGASVTGRFKRDVAEEVQQPIRQERSIQPKSRDNPIKPHILINRPSPTIPEHETDMRFRRAALENYQVLPDINKRRTLPIKPDILIYRPSPTFPVNPKPDNLRFLREVDDDAVAMEQEDLYRNKRYSHGMGMVRPRPEKPDILIYRPSPTFPVNPIRLRRDADDAVEENQDGLSGDLIEVSPDQRPLRIKPVGADDLTFRPNPTFPNQQTRFRRDVGEDAAEDLTEDINEDLYRQKRSFAPGGGSFPSPGSNQQGNRGSWGVSVNKDKGRGPQVRTEGQGNIYTSPKGNVRVDGNGHHEFGKGRKPDYGGGVKVQGRWRREAIDGTEDELAEELSETDVTRTRRFAQGGFPGSSGGQQQDRGSWGVSVNKDKGRGPQIRTEGQGNIYTSPNGNVRVDGHGHHEFGKGRKPDYGVGVKVEGRWRREAIDDVEDELAEEVSETEVTRTRRYAQGGFPGSSGGRQQDRGSWGVSVNKDKGRGPQIRTEGQGNIYTSPKGNVRVDGHGHHEFGKGRKPDYGVGVKVQGRWRREAIDDAEDELAEEVSETEVTRTKRFTQGGYNFPGSTGGQQQDRGSWGVSVNKDKGRGPQIRTEGQGNIYTSPNGNVRVDGHGHHEFGKGRKPDYGVGVKVQGRWRREAEDIEDAGDIIESERVRREANPQRDRGSVSVNVDRGPSGRPQIRTDANYNIYKSPSGNWNVHGNGYHQAGHGQKPSYGAGVTLTGRF